MFFFSGNQGAVFHGDCSPAIRYSPHDPDENRDGAAAAVRFTEQGFLPWRPTLRLSQRDKQ